LEVLAGSYSASAASETYQWQVDGRAVAGATDPVFVPQPSHLGAAVSVWVTADAGTGGSLVSVASAAGPVEPGSLEAVNRPTIAGTAQVGGQLQAVAGSYRPDGVALSYQWLADGVAIAGATGDSLAVAADLIGTRLSVIETASAAAYHPVQTTATAASLVAPMPDSTTVAAPLTALTAPALTGTFRVGQTLKVVPGNYNQADVTVAVQWLRGGVPIARQTSLSYRLRPADRGRLITVRLTATKADARHTTDLPGGKVRAGLITASAKPTITGSARLGRKLRAKTAFTTPGLRLSYRWYRNGKAIKAAARATYLVKPADVGKRLTVRVVASRVGYATTTARAAATAKVLPRAKTVTRQKQ
jgi:hypothetical protein